MLSLHHCILSSLLFCCDFLIWKYILKTVFWTSCCPTYSLIITNIAVVFLKYKVHPASLVLYCLKAFRASTCVIKISFLSVTYASCLRFAFTLRLYHLSLQMDLPFCALTFYRHLLHPSLLPTPMGESCPHSKFLKNIIFLIVSFEPGKANHVFTSACPTTFPRTENL